MPNLNGLLRTTFFALFGLVLCWNGNAVIHDDNFPGLDDNFPELDDDFLELDDDFLEPKPASNSSATTTKPASNSSAKPISTTSAPKVNVGGAVLGVLGMVSGGAMMYDSIDAKEEKTTWKDVAIGAGGGATAAAGTAAVVNAIPVFGQIAYGSMVAVGTVVGASGALLKMFSETDCPRDPVTGQLSCCNISNLTNLKGARRADIGDEMFGEFPYVHTCMQGKNKVKSKGPAGWIRDDHWSEKGEVKFCSGWVMPVDGDYNIQRYGSSEQEGKVCWQWECADKGMRRQGGKCVAASDTSGANATGTEKSGQGTKQKLPAQTKSGDAGENAEGKWREPCSKEDLLKVPHATAGRYIYRTKDEIVCAATACEAGYYLVKNAEGKSQGWCQYGKDPYATTNASETKSGQGTSSSDASGTGTSGADATGTATSGAGTSAKKQPSGGTDGQVQQTAPVVEKSPCELGQPGWLVFEGRCITDTQHQNILVERQAAKVRALAQKIESTASQLDSMSSKFKVSVWKDAEGKFNTARLASDSIAGVVLGTAGGLITSHVVKKNQVENGFQDIKCTIGGQSVANWGDEFSVGIQ